MANAFGTDILIQAKDPVKAANFYVKELGFVITDQKPNMISLHGKNINFFYRARSGSWACVRSYRQEREGSQGEAQEEGPQSKDEPDFPRCYVKDRYGLIYSLTE